MYIGTVKPRFTVFLHLPGLILPPNTEFMCDINSNSIYRAPPYTVLFCVPPKDTVNGG